MNNKSRAITLMFIAFGIICCSNSAAFPQEASPARPSQEVAEEKIYIPKNLDESFTELKKMLPKKELEAFMAKDEDKAVTDAHFGLGMWIRNYWLRPSDSPLAKSLREMGLRHPDDMSSAILGAFWCQLHGKPLRIDERIKGYDEYWKYSTVPKGTVSPKDGATIDFIQSMPCKEPAMPKDCRTHLGVSKSDGSAWAYQWGKGVFEPSDEQKQEILTAYKKYSGQQS